MSRPISGTVNTVSKRALKNPLRVSTMSLSAPATVGPGDPEFTGQVGEPTMPEVTVQQLRKMQISEFSAWLRTQTNKHKRPLYDQNVNGWLSGDDRSFFVRCLHGEDGAAGVAPLRDDREQLGDA